MAPTPALIAACSALAVLTSCTSPVVTPAPTPSVSASSPTPTTAPPSSSPTPSPTWTVDQAAAIAAVDGYRAASDKIGANPAAFTEAQMRSMLKRWAGPAVVTANVGSYLSLKKRGFRYDIQTKVLTTDASRPADVGHGREVVITRCMDQSPAKVLDKDGDEVTEAELGYRVSRFLLRQYTVQKRSGTQRFLVYGLSPTKGKCGAS